MAVIVILAIIALIATPIVLDIIEDSKANSNKRSIDLYVSAVEQAIARYQLNGQAIPSGKYTTEDGKTLTHIDTTIKVDYDGAKTVCDVYISSKGTISLKNCKVNNKNIEYTYGNKIYENGEVVYFDVTTGESCNNYHEDNSKTKYNGIITSTENQNGCLKFYAFNDFGSDTLNLLLDHSTTAIISWNLETNNNLIGPSNIFFEKLKTNTDAWKGTEIPTNYSIDLGEGKAKYTIDYSDYKARIITAQEVAQITGNTTFDERTLSSSFYFDTNTKIESTTCRSGDTSGCRYGWLYDRTSTSCTTYGCLNNSDVDTYGYWTATAAIYNQVYIVGFLNASISQGFVDENHGGQGIRPVIEVLKSKLF